MSSLVYILANAAYLFVVAIEVCMFIRAILSWFPFIDGNSFTEFIYRATEVFIYPVRRLLERSELVMSMPIDIPFFVTFLLLAFISTLLSA